MTEEKKVSEDNESGWDEALLPVLQDIVGKAVEGVCDIKAIDIAIRSLSPSVVVASSGLPSLVGMLSSKLAHGLFTSPVYRDLFKDSLIEAGRRLRDKIQEKGGMKNVTKEEYGEAVQEGFQAAAEKKYVVIDGLLHQPNCWRIQPRLKQPQRRSKEKDGQQQPQQQQAQPVAEVTLLEAEQQHVMCAPCCFDGVQADIKTKTEAPAKVEAPKPPPRSPMEVINRAAPEDRAFFLKWLKGLPADERKRVDEYLKHLDSEEEFNALVGCIKDEPEVVYEMMMLLENSNGSLRTKQFILLAGQAIERHSMEALGAIKCGIKHAARKVVETDEMFAPVAKRLRENESREKPEPTFRVALGLKKPENKGFLHATGRFVKSLFLFF